MRTETEVLKHIIDYASSSEDVRAVIQNGSRVNPNLKPDVFSDYDIVFIVERPSRYKENKEWIKKFGELLIHQENDCEKNGVKWVIFLLLFSDGVRIDLSFFPKSAAQMQTQDSLKKLLLDKDNLFKPFGTPDNASYVTRKPSEERYYKAINEFFWCATNIAKGIRRDEFCYVKSMHEMVVRKAMLQIIDWYIGMKNNWRVDTGKFGRWFHKLLAPDIWRIIKNSYAGHDYEDIWESLLASGKLVRKLGMELAERLGYPYPLDEDENVTAYLHAVRRG